MKTNNLTEKTTLLTEKSGRDSLTIKWITTISLLYLPGSFVAVSNLTSLCSAKTEIAQIFQTLYGMNLFMFDQHSKRIVMAENFWIYAATWIPLTLLTIFVYGVCLFWKASALNRWRWMERNRAQDVSSQTRLLA